MEAAEQEKTPANVRRKMDHPMKNIARFAIGIVLLCAMDVAAAELQFRAKCQPRGAVVTLGDVADIYGGTPQQRKELAAIELFPAPAFGQQRTLRVGEIEDLLVYRPIDLTKHQLSGASLVTITSSGAMHAGGLKSPSAPAVKRTERLVQEAVVQYLQEKAGAEEPWSVKVRLNDEQVRAIPLDVRRISVEGGELPWIGVQQFEAVVDADGRAQRVSFEAEVGKRVPVVVAVAALPRGEVVRESDVKLQTLPAGEERVDAVTALEDIVGRETTRAVAVGAVITRQAVRSPLLVRRGEIVTVYARTNGIVVRTTARAKEEGGMGDLISVESIADRKAFTARVSGIQETEVYGRAIRTNRGADAPGPSSREVARNRAPRS
jgi:flagella basal body P-ring formation protein FlgA